MPQKRSAENDSERYILSCARLNPPAPVFSTLSAVHDCLSVASPSCLYHYIRWNTPLNPSSDNSHLLDFQISFCRLYLLYFNTEPPNNQSEESHTIPITQSLSTFSSNNASCFLTHSSPAVTPALRNMDFFGNLCLGLPSKKRISIMRRSRSAGAASPPPATDPRQCSSEFFLSLS